MRRTFTLIVAAALVTLSIPPANSAGDAIGRANLDGSNVRESFIPGISFPSRLAVDSGHLYWGDITTNAIGRASLSGAGANPGFIRGADGPFDVAVDAGHAYWVNYDTGTIGRANLDGSGANQRFIEGASQPAGVAVDPSHVYWTNYAGGTIGRASLDGSGANQSFIAGADAPGGVAVDAHHIYWANSYADTIGRANLDGSNVSQSFITGASYPQDVAVDSDHVYWANEGRANLDGTGNNTGTIGRANLDGSRATQRFISEARESTGVAVDANHVYWSNSPVPKAAVSVSVHGTALVVAAGPGASDNVAITRPSRFNFRVTDFPSGPYTGSVVHAGPGCTRRGEHVAYCPASGITPVLPVLVTSGDRADRVVNSSGLPGSLHGEGGDDRLIGGPARDILKGGPGVDVIEGLDGNDLLRANDGVSDKRIDCGGGSDLADLDLLPEDAKVNGCERKVRH